MSKENVELVRALMPDGIDMAEVLKGDDPGSLLAGRPVDAIDPDVQVVFEGTQTGGPPVVFDGLGGLLEGWVDWLIPWESYRLDIEEIIDAGDHVVVTAKVTARTERHGVELEHGPAAVWSLRDGRVVAVRFFLERDHAFEFAGRT